MQPCAISVLACLLAAIGGAAGPSGLGAKLAPGAATVVLWSHSGVGVETAGHFLIFDYIRSTARSGGRVVEFVDPAELPGKTPVVFVSHAHRDHHDAAIYDWAKTLPTLHYVVSADVAGTSSFRRAALPPARVSVLGPGERRVILDGGVEVRTVESTDAGVAFRVLVDGLRIVHSGDHALWNWKPERAAAMRDAYLGGLRRLVADGGGVDIAFLCADLRLPGLSGAAEGAALLDPGMIVAIHNYARQAEAGAALRGALSPELRARVAEVTGPGTLLSFPERVTAVAPR